MFGLMINGQLEYISDIEGFIDLVEKYMGVDSAKFLDDEIKKTKGMKNKIEKAKEKLQFGESYEEVWKVLSEE